ncbi:chitin synthase chs-2-like [Ylistrum balloti]|uniref:chitin synthase chs-2-like n=1 Tax=Ylistrum balloti TaxID=509963 RepID=UPI002905A507|nr:chitin synthase chs-2-like [Ylistrum balloti]
MWAAVPCDVMWEDMWAAVPCDVMWEDMWAAVLCDVVWEDMRAAVLCDVVWEDMWAAVPYDVVWEGIFRDISFTPNVSVGSSEDACERILSDAGINGYAIAKGKVLLRHWHGPVLQEIVAERKQMMASAHVSYMMDNDIVDLDDATSVSIDTKRRPILEAIVDVRSADSSSSKQNNTLTSSASSHTRVAEWMQQQDHVTSDVSLPTPVYSNTPPPVFSKKSSHVRIKMPRKDDSLLDMRLWDRFQMIPRERVSTSDTFRPFLRAFKIFCYVLFFCVVLGSAVVSKLCILLMSSSILKDKKALRESNSPTNTMLVITICFPYIIWMFSFSAKSLFGSNAWPSFKTIVITLFMELLHSFGLCLMVFHILPRMDMARGLLQFCGICTVPAFLKTITIATDKSRPTVKRLTLTFINGLAFVIQLCNLAASTMFSNPLKEAERDQLQRDVIYDPDILHTVGRPAPMFENRYMWEIPVALVFISVSYWENFVESDLSICTLNIPFLQWKRRLNSVRERLYIFVGIWKTGWTLLFAALLLPGFSFNIEFSTSGSNPSGTRIGHTTTVAAVASGVTVTSKPPIRAPPVGGSRKIPLVKRAISDQIGLNGVSAVLNLTNANLKSRTPKFRPRPLPVPSTSPSIENPSPTINGSSDVNYNLQLPESVKRNFERYGPLYLQLLCSAVLSYFGSLACKLCMQVIGFALPLFLATPLTLGIIIVQCYSKFIPSYLYIWLCPEMAGEIRMFHLLWLGVLWVSQIILTSHIWFPRNGRMAKIDRLFVMPIRCGILTDQSLILRRRTNDRDSALFSSDDDASTLTDDEEVHRADDVVPQIYACATMWHETRCEMTQLLKSLFRMDIDHSARFLAQKFYGIRDPDYYEFEAHVFFDDAMELSDDDKLIPNSFVAELMDCIDDAISSVHERQMTLAPPVRTPTPYGGRMTWRLPGGTRLVVHLKDKHKIRHKKRWSQVMYMYYLLGYRILAQPENLIHRDVLGSTSTPDNDSNTHRVKLTETQLRQRRQSSHFTRSVIFNYVSDEVHTQAENTFILTLDGDVDFKPDAVRLLVDRLKKNKKVGAACGRIHPVGSGPIMWYQEFEYAIGHWLQKATEHVFGCVLCAPGCFSLFRGSALMDDNVARTYAIRTTEAGQYVQYDQGEDRWLSTLLLQQGYRIDYCAAADALTHAPETFSEFFNQRRRWGPSTLANVIDLLGDWKNTVRLNDNISTPYVLYQFFLLVSTLLGPATVLLMMAGAFSVVFKTSVVQSYALSLIPPIAFIVLCIYAKPTTQVTIATIMSACYAIIMTIVLIGTIGTAIDGSLTSPNVVFLLILVIIFFVAALMHPEEFACVIPGALYFICIPTGYLVLTIYYLCNLHIVSWGTRELPMRKSKEEVLEEKKALEEKRLKRQRKGILGWLGLDSFLNETADMFRQLRQATLVPKLDTKSKTDELLEELVFELRQSRDTKMPPRSRPFSAMTDACKADTKVLKHESSNERQSHKPETFMSKPDVTDKTPLWMKNEDPENPGWLQDSVCGEGPIKRMDQREMLFWGQLLKRYLHPIVEDKIHQEKVAADLKNLRNNVVFGFFMTSALWIALTMQLQLLQDEFKDTALFIKIPHYDPLKKDLTFEPLGMFFLGLFGTILVFQFIGMLSHRWGTILHVLSITDVSCGKKFTEKYKIQEIIMKTMELQRVINIENEPEPDYDDPIADYEEEDVDDDDEMSSNMYTDTLSSASSTAHPPSYHSQDCPNKKANLRRRNSAIFNKRGFSTGRTLRRAFERRFRNQLKRERSGETQATDDSLSNIHRAVEMSESV